MSLDPLLLKLLAELGLSPERAPDLDEARWRELLQRVSAEYDAQAHGPENQAQRLAHQAAIQSQKMEALGEMAAGIAHEINNPLAVITGKVEQLKRTLESGEAPSPVRLRDLVDKVEKNSRRIVQIIKGLRSFSRDDSKGDATPISTQSLIEDTLTLCRDRLMGGRMQFNLLQPEDAILVKVRPSQISQIILNLLNNAVDACEKVPDPRITLAVAAAPEWVEIRVWDNGPGVSAAIEQKIMQPFFTTKPSGKGTGLGLSISLGIARDHGGSLALDRKVAPSCFVLRLPRLSLEQLRAS